MKLLSRTLWFSGVVLILMFVASMLVTGGVFTYLQDDAYIHLAIAKNVAASFTWGINPGEFASASSSPLWIVILSFAYLIFGKFAEYIPLLINILAVLFLVALSAALLIQYGYRGGKYVTAIVFLILVTPLFPFAFGGMEHPLHILSTVLFALTVGEYLSREKSLSGVWPWKCVKGEGGLFWLMVILSPLVAGFRYEGIFVVFVASLFLLFAKRVKEFFAVSIAGSLPVFGFAFWSLAQGGGLVPNTLLIKKKVASSLLESLGLIAQSAYQNIKMPLFMIFAPLLSLVVAYRAKVVGTLYRTEMIALAIVSASFVLQALFGRLSWVAMFRYEAYLVFAGILFVMLALSDINFKSWFTKKALTWGNVFLIGGLFIISLPFLRRLVSWPYAIMSAKNIHEQTRQVGNFLNAEYAGRVVGASDIGLVAYPGKVELIDFWGLANSEVMKARVSGKYGRDEMERIAEERNVEVVAVFDSWFGSSIPQKWIKVGEWAISHNYTTGGDTVSFYGTSCGRAKELLEKMALHKVIPQVKEVLFKEEVGIRCSVDK